ncbi:cytochrome b-c1 complex subunit 8 [Fomitopsis betulina]|nr:cytochrome b-c1 complex subunit 8 [Fomitopsis betulina]
MRPTAAAHSEMPGPKVYNVWWGFPELPKQKGITQYAMSPMRQRATHNMFRNWMFNGYRRLSGQVGYFIVPFALGYATYSWGNSHYAYLNSKAGHLAHGGH